MSLTGQDGLLKQLTKTVLTEACPVEIGVPRDRQKQFGGGRYPAECVLERMADWQSRPLDRAYPEVIIDAIHFK